MGISREEQKEKTKFGEGFVFSGLLKLFSWEDDNNCILRQTLFSNANITLTRDMLTQRVDQTVVIFHFILINKAFLKFRE